MLNSKAKIPISGEVDPSSSNCLFRGGHNQNRDEEEEY
jgi:hypothetical protein